MLRLLQIFRFSLSRIGYAVNPVDKNYYPDQAKLCEYLSMDSVFDIGANVGKTGQTYKQLFPGATLTLVEPIPEFAEILRDEFNEDNVVQAALGGENGKAKFNITLQKDNSSLLSPDIDVLPKSYHLGMKSDRVEIIDVIKLDDLCNDRQVERINLLKLDLQGSELSALYGAKSLLEKGMIDVICTEAFFLPFYKGSPLFDDLIRFLGQYGYVLHGIYNPSISGRTGRVQWIDAIFVAPHMVEYSKKIQVDNIIGR